MRRLDQFRLWQLLVAFAVGLVMIVVGGLFMKNLLGFIAFAIGVAIVATLRIRWFRDANEEYLRRKRKGGA